MSDTIKEGNMVQVWDWQDGGTTKELISHGRIGYTVKKEEDLGRDGSLWKVIFFDGGNAAYAQIHEEWLTVINSTDDVREVEKDGV